jgi:hypothetical protein
MPDRTFYKALAVSLAITAVIFIMTWVIWH